MHETLQLDKVTKLLKLFFHSLNFILHHHRVNFKELKDKSYTEDV